MTDSMQMAIDSAANKLATAEANMDQIDASLAKLAIPRDMTALANAINVVLAATAAIREQLAEMRKYQFEMLVLQAQQAKKAAQ